MTRDNIPPRSGRGNNVRSCGMFPRRITAEAGADLPRVYGRFTSSRIFTGKKAAVTERLFQLFQLCSVCFVYVPCIYKRFGTSKTLINLLGFRHFCFSDRDQVFPGCRSAYTVYSKNLFSGFLVGFESIDGVGICFPGKFQGFAGFTFEASGS